MKGYGRMHNYKWKVSGLVVAGLGLVLWLAHYFTDFVLVEKYNTDQHSFMFWWITLAGLYLTAFSKEKYDDERVKAIRAKSMQAGFTLAMAVLLSVSLTEFLAVDMSFEANAIIIIPTFCLVFYLLLFHVGLYFDNLWDYSDDDAGIFKNAKGDKKQLNYIIYFVILALLLGLAIFENFAGK